MKSLFSFLLVAFLLSCNSKSEEDNEFDKRLETYKKINEKFKPQEIEEVETPTAQTRKEIKNDSLFLISCTKDSLYSTYLKKQINFKNTVELKKYLLTHIEKLRDKKFAVKSSADARLQTLQKVINILQDSVLAIHTFSLITDLEKFE